MSNSYIRWLVFAVFLFGAGVMLWSYHSASRNKDNSAEETKIKTDYHGNLFAVMETNFGKIKLKLFADTAPMTVENFIKLSKSGFYDGTKFHRVIKGFMIQGGDPNSKDGDWSDDGKGGPGYVFDDEINGHKLVRGALAMANAGPNTNGSQFFVVTASSTPWLDGKHTVFGEVVSGMNVVEKIENLSVNENKHPLKDATIQSIKIIE